MIFELLAIALWVGAGLVVAKVVKSGYGPARTQLEGWAGTAGFKLISASPRVFWRGPFFFSSGMRKVFRIIAMDNDGVVKRGWACCGWFFTSWKTGLAEKVLVEWDS